LQRVQLLATRLAAALDLTESEIQAIKTASLLHDIGKLAIPEHILSKPGRLTEEEFQRVRIHPVVGAEIIADVPLPALVAPAILGHHERWDGTGYPRGLRGTDIPLAARIVALADTFDAITHRRRYDAARSAPAAVEVIAAERGRQFDPELTDLFLSADVQACVHDAMRLSPPDRGLRACKRNPAAELGDVPDVAFRWRAAAG